jgi:hypothetical protein
VKIVGDVLAGVSLDALPLSTIVVEVMGMLCARYQLGLCPVSIQDRTVIYECVKLFDPGQAMRCRY